MPIQQPIVNATYVRLINTSAANITIFLAGMSPKITGKFSMGVYTCSKVFLNHAETKQLSVDPANIPVH